MSIYIYIFPKIIRSAPNGRWHRYCFWVLPSHGTLPTRGTTSFYVTRGTISLRHARCTRDLRLLRRLSKRREWSFWNVVVDKNLHYTVAGNIAIFCAKKGYNNDSYIPVQGCTYMDAVIIFLWMTYVVQNVSSCNRE